MESNSYVFLLFLHSLLRWIALLGFGFTLGRLVYSFSQKEGLTSVAKIGNKITMILVDIQFLIGMILYIFLSPVTQTAFADFKGAMKTKELRFFAVEHIFTMILILIALHVANVIGKKDIPKDKALRIVLGIYVFVLALFLVGIPWYRPLLRGI